MDDLEDANMVLMEGIGKAIEVLLREEVGFILGCKQARREATSSPFQEKKKKKNLSNAKLKKGNSNIDRVVTIYWKLKDNFKRQLFNLF